MKKLFALITILLFSFVGSALATSTGQTHRVFLNASGWVRIYNAGGLVTDCGGYAGSSQYFARISTPTETIAYLHGASIQIPSAVTTTVNSSSVTTYDQRLITYTGVEIVPVDFTDWYNSNDEVGGISPGSGGLFLTEVTAATDAFAWCDYQDAD